MPYSTENIEFG